VRTSAVCCPRAGAGQVISTGELLILYGTVGYAAVPSTGCATSRKKPRWRYCAERRRSAAPFTGTSGTPRRRAVSATAFFV